jgi:hypothetical protein
MIGDRLGHHQPARLPLDEAGAVLEQRESAQGILSVPEGGFPAVLEAEIGPGSTRARSWCCSAA